MVKAQPPTFHIPIGRHRQDGEVMPFENNEDAAAAMDVWRATILRHPATLAARCCVIIGPGSRQVFDLRTHTMIQSPARDEAWEPAAVSDVIRPH